eukprot:Rhum_TRINITY_DN19820_c0_g1::Rhum_TRINITY_DN19820_c0_g1_i1::g.170688::m.170688/K14573/NOP4, RBM28; nucleolar protein 4
MGKYTKKGGGGWQSRVGRLLRKDEEADTKAQEAAAAKAAAKAERVVGRDVRQGTKRPREEKRERDGDGDDAAPVEDSAEEVAKRRRTMYKEENKAAQLFVGNLPFDVTEDDIVERFSSFGKVKKVLLVKDRESGHMTGVGFIHFMNEASVDKVLKENAAQKVLHGVDTSPMDPKLNNKKAMKRQIFKGTLGEEQNKAGIVFNGRTLKVNSVVSKRDAAGLTRQEAITKEKEELADPRNLQLLEEGRILANAPGAAAITEGRLQLLQQRYQMKKRKLKDPNFFVSRTRLSIRDLPAHVDTPALKKVVTNSIRAFTEAHPEFQPDAESQTKDNPYIKMMKVVMDPATNISRGFAFAEFRQHEVALAVLRNLNNNPNVFHGKRLDVEFAVESVHALQKLRRITDQGRERNKAMRGYAAKGQDPRAAWREEQEETQQKKAADKEKRKKEFEKYKKFLKYSGRKNKPQ